METDRRVVMSVDECAVYLNISRPQAYLGVRRGEIPHIRVGRRILISVAALEKMLLAAGINEKA